MGKALLMVSFGTSYPETLEKNISRIEAALAAALPDRTLFRAFTSGMILRKLARRDGVQIDNVDQALERLAREGYEDVLLQPTHILNGEEYDKLFGFEIGSDDYVTKPFSVTVLCRKVAAIFDNMELRTPRHDLFDDGFLKIDFSEQSASFAGKSLDFTPKEYRTLSLFVKNPRIILTKRQILEKLWDIEGDFVDEHTLATTISRIRKKIETNEHKYIKTAYGMGYQWIGGEPK